MILVLIASALFVRSLSDEVTSLPGLDGDIGFPLHAGYVEVSPGHQLYYTFAESQNDPSKDPVVLWMQGGPGCSSVGIGLFEELGPFRPDGTGKTLTRNPFSWNKNASLLGIDFPANTGFSYTTDMGPFHTGDRATIANVLKAVTTLFKNVFPKYKGRPFIVAGESYAGHYVPLFAEAVLEATSNPNSSFPLDFKGMMVGNAWTDPAYDMSGAVDWWHSHCIISDSTHTALTKHCTAEYPNLWVIVSTDADDPIDPPMGPKNPLCKAAGDQASAEFGPIDPLDILAPICLAKSGNSKRRARKRTGKERGLGGSYLDPCIDQTGVPTYLNNPAVQVALHANQTSPTTQPWMVCAVKSQLLYSGSDVVVSMLPVYKKLMSTSSIDVLVYSGDMDSDVPITATRRWLASLELEIAEPFAAYKDNAGQVAGYRWQYAYQPYGASLEFKSVKGAGHEVPFYAPEHGFELLTNFLGKVSTKTVKNYTCRVAMERWCPKNDTSSTPSDQCRTCLQKFKTEIEGMANTSTTSCPTASEITDYCSQKNSPDERSTFPIWAIALIALTAVVACLSFLGYLVCRKKSGESASGFRTLA